ncbi:hypothetical protein NIB75_18865 [Bacteroides uniformis]|nr:hypothetical protein [Bacteroides uniformis]
MSLSAPQLEAGRNVTPYRATDEALSYTDDYGAWFNKGGIGGTIQNPLLRLNEDGSIVSRDGSFVIHPDGTGHFASGRFKWGKDTIELRDVTIRWEDLDEEAQELLKPRSVSPTGGTAFHFKDELSRAHASRRISRLWRPNTISSRKVGSGNTLPLTAYGKMPDAMPPYLK